MPDDPNRDPLRARVEQRLLGLVLRVRCTLAEMSNAKSIPARPAPAPVAASAPIHVPAEPRELEAPTEHGAVALQIRTLSSMHSSAHLLLMESSLTLREAFVDTTIAWKTLAEQATKQLVATTASFERQLASKEEEVERLTKRVTALEVRLDSFRERG